MTHIFETENDGDFLFIVLSHDLFTNNLMRDMIDIIFDEDSPIKICENSF